MELNDWIINQRDLHYITKKQYKRLYRSGLKALGDYLQRGRKINCHDDDEEKMIIGKSVNYTVYLCEWRGLIVAVKRLDIKQLDDGMKHKLTQHLKHEICILVKMHHPNIVQILGITLDPFQIVLEYFPLRDLNYFQSRHKSILFSCFLSASRYKTKYKWTIDILLALIYLHERRPESVIHRDLKPSNVLITNDDSLKITDFGLSKLHTDYYEILSTSEQNLENMMDTHPKKFDTFDIGTYWYMSPEIRTHTPYDNKMDIWSLGLVLYEIWENCRVNTIVDSPVDFIEKNSTRRKWIPFTFRTPTIMREIILQCLDKEPSCRPSVRKILARTFSMPKRWLWF